MNTLVSKIFLVATLVIAALVGCARQSPAPQSLDDLPLTEPTSADRPDEKAAQSFVNSQSSHSGVVAWPQLFGPNRTSSVEGAVDPVWGDEGPAEVWSINVGSGYGSSVVANTNVVFNHRQEDEEIVQCVNAHSGEAIWEHRYPTTFECEMEYSSGPYSTPLIYEDVVYAVGGQAQVSCLDLKTGTPVWKRDLKTDYELKDDIFSFGNTPLVFENLLILNPGGTEKDAGIIALDRKSGETIWEATDHGAAYCSPVVAQIGNETFVFVVTQRGLVSLDPSSGDVDWQIEHRCRAPMSYNSVSPLVFDDKVLVVTGPGPGALCVRVSSDRSYQQLWKNRRVLDSQYNTLMLDKGNVFGFTASGQGGAELRCVDFQTGDLKWKYHSVLRRGQGLIVGRAMILLGEKGHLASLLVNDKEPKVLAFTQQPLMSEPCYCAPAFSDGYLYLKDETRVACFDLKVSKD